MLFVGLPVERQKDAHPRRATQGLQRAGDGFDGRRLIVVSVEGAEGPAELRNGEGGTEARADGGLGDGRLGRTCRKIAFGETRGTHAGRERHPGKGIELVIDVEGLEIGVRGLADGEGRISAAVVEDGAEGLVVALVEAEESNLQIVLLVVGGEGSLASDVGGGAVFRGGDGNVVGIAGVVAAVVVVEGRHRGEEMGIESVQPSEKESAIELGLVIAKIQAGKESGQLSID